MTAFQLQELANILTVCVCSTKPTRELSSCLMTCWQRGTKVWLHWLQLSDGVGMVVGGGIKLQSSNNQFFSINSIGSSAIQHLL